MATPDRMVRAEILDKLQSIGAKKRYKPYWLDEEKRIGLECRKPMNIIDGWMVGTDIVLTKDFQHFQVVTKHKKTVVDLAKVHKLGGHLNLAHEAEIMVPAAGADQVLHKLGAKVRKTRVLTPEQVDALKARLAKVRAKKKSGS